MTSIEILTVIILAIFSSLVVTVITLYSVKIHIAKKTKKTIATLSAYRKWKVNQEQKSMETLYTTILDMYKKYNADLMKYQKLVERVMEAEKKSSTENGEIFKNNIDILPTTTTLNLSYPSTYLSETQKEIQHTKIDKL